MSSSLPLVLRPKFSHPGVNQEYHHLNLKPEPLRIRKVVKLPIMVEHQITEMESGGDQQVGEGQGAGVAVEEGEQVLDRSGSGSEVEARDAKIDGKETEKKITILIKINEQGKAHIEAKTHIKAKVAAEKVRENDGQGSTSSITQTVEKEEDGETATQDDVDNSSEVEDEIKDGDETESDEEARATDMTIEDGNYHSSSSSSSSEEIEDFQIIELEIDDDGDVPMHDLSDLSELDDFLEVDSNPPSDGLGIYLSTTTTTTTNSAIAPSVPAQSTPIRPPTPRLTACELFSSREDTQWHGVSKRLPLPTINYEEPMSKLIRVTVATLSAAETLLYTTPEFARFRCRYPSGLRVCWTWLEEVDEDMTEDEDEDGKLWDGSVDDSEDYEDGLEAGDESQEL